MIDPLLQALIDSVPRLPLRTEQVPVARAGGRVFAGASQSGLRQGAALSPRDIAALASLGEARVEVYPRPTVAVFSFGDTLLHPGQPAQDGHRFDLAAPMLQALLAMHGIESLAWPALPAARIEAALGDALDSFDVVLLSAAEDAADSLRACLPRLAVALPSGGDGAPSAWLSSRARLLLLASSPEELERQFEAFVLPLLAALQYARP
jgi:molybdopterin biosynthesis enzyme